MRIVAGSARGRRLVAPEGDTTRPTSDRVRESMFNALFSLGAIDDARVVDLFAGSGALGFEALSRGASHCVFVDPSRAAAAAVRINAASLSFEDRVDIATTTAMTWIGRQGSPGAEGVDLVLCDPPYDFHEWDDLLAALWTVAPGATVVIESDRAIIDTDPDGHPARPVAASPGPPPDGSPTAASAGRDGESANGEKSSSDEAPPPPEHGWVATRTRRYGSTIVQILEPPAGSGC